MGKRSKTGVLKRLREVKKAEKAALKREEMRERKDSGTGEEPVESRPDIATDEDLAGYGFPVDDEEETFTLTFEEVQTSVALWILDLDGEPVDLEVSYTADGGDDQTPVWAPGGHGTTGLTTLGGIFEAEGQAHLLRWDVSELDPSASVRLTLVPGDLLDQGAAAARV